MGILNICTVYALLTARTVMLGMAFWSQLSAVVSDNEVSAADWETPAVLSVLYAFISVGILV